MQFEHSLTMNMKTNLIVFVNTCTRIIKVYILEVSIQFCFNQILLRQFCFIYVVYGVLGRKFLKYFNIYKRKQYVKFVVCLVLYVSCQASKTIPSPVLSLCKPAQETRIPNSRCNHDFYTNVSQPIQIGIQIIFLIHHPPYLVFSSDYITTYDMLIKQLFSNDIKLKSPTFRINWKTKKNIVQNCVPRDIIECYIVVRIFAIQIL